MKIYSQSLNWIKCSQICLILILVLKVFKNLKNLDPNKSGGPDNISSRFLKETAVQLASIYQHLFTLSYNSGVLPTSWRHALVCPIFKKGRKDLAENYRPVSLTSIPCKLFEHIIVSKTWEHLNRYNIITKNQHGFRSGLSCETQLVDALYDWTEALNRGSGQIDCIVLDFSKAFDVVPHERLLAKINSYGITGATSNWIRSFLSNRTQNVVINGKFSKASSVTSGVPQGTVLGPLLFLLYINDIGTEIDSNIRLFADDSALYREIKSFNDVLSLQEDLFKLQEWASKWQMKFNIKKCKTLRISKRIKNKINHIYVMKSATSDPIPLEEITSDRYLGVILDNKLSFNEHIKEITKKATNLLNLCRRNLKMCSPKAKEIAYKALVRPHLEYASSAWSPYTKRAIDDIEAVQRRAARFVLGDYNYGPNSHLSLKMSNILKWQSLHHRRASHDLALFYKIRSGICKNTFPDVVKSSPYRPNSYIHVQALHSEVYKNHFYLRSVRLWNLLPENLRLASSFPVFKSQVEQWIAPLQWSKANGTWSLSCLLYTSPSPRDS